MKIIIIFSVLVFIFTGCSKQPVYTGTVVNECCKQKVSKVKCTDDVKKVKYQNNCTPSCHFPVAVRKKCDCQKRCK